MTDKERINELVIGIDGLNAQISFLKMVLREVEWIGQWDECPMCHRYRKNTQGHDPKCLLARALAITPREALQGKFNADCL